MTARKAVSVLAETLRTSGAITGPARTVLPTIRAAGCAWQHDSRRGRFLVPLSAFDDVLARLEADGHRVDVIGGGLW